MNFLKKLFTGGETTPTAPEPETYKGFTIRADPIKDGATWRISAHVEKDGKAHHLIRVDTLTDRDECAAASIAKAKQVIDQQGDRLFN